MTITHNVGAQKCIFANGKKFSLLISLTKWNQRLAYDCYSFVRRCSSRLYAKLSLKNRNSRYFMLSTRSLSSYSDNPFFFAVRVVHPLWPCKYCIMPAQQTLCQPIQKIKFWTYFFHLPRKDTSHPLNRLDTPAESKNVNVCPYCLLWILACKFWPAVHLTMLYARKDVFEMKLLLLCSRMILSIFRCQRWISQFAFETVRVGRRKAWV
jgi:hypothetical protein